MCVPPQIGLDATPAAAVAAAVAEGTLEYTGASIRWRGCHFCRQGFCCWRTSCFQTRYVKEKAPFWYCTCDAIVQVRQTGRLAYVP